jgi:hypothetical protein
VEGRKKMQGSQARTEHGEFRFTVKEGADGTPWIAAEPQGQTMPALKDAFVGFGLPEGVTLAEAYRTADFMNKHLQSMSLTIFDSHPLYAKAD